MSTGRITQVTKAVIGSDELSPVRVTQASLAPVIRADEDARITQVSLAPVIQSNEPARITQVTLVVVYSATPFDWSTEGCEFSIPSP